VSTKSKSALVTHLKRFITSESSVLELSSVTSDVSSEVTAKKSQSTLITINGNNVLTNSYSLPFPTASFDHAVISGGIEYVTEPRELFRELWRVLRPGAKCFVTFVDKPQKCSDLTAPLTPLQMWETMTAEQKLWIAGSYFNYSSRFGWENIEGYDLFSSTGAANMVFESPSDAENCMYIVQADRTSADILPTLSASRDEVLVYLSACMQGLRNIGTNSNAEATYSQEIMELLTNRLATLFEMSSSSSTKTDILTLYPRRLVQIYDVLKDVKEVVIPNPVKAMLAIFIVDKWDNSPAMRVALSQGVGLLPISAMESEAATFWTELSNVTSALQPRDKIALLGDLVPALSDTSSSTSSSTRSRALRVPALVAAATTIFREKFRDTVDEEIVSVSSDLSISEFLYSTRSMEESFQRVIAYVKSIDKNRFNEILSSSRTLLVKDPTTTAASDANTNT